LQYSHSLCLILQSELERHLREYLDIMANEPDGYIKISEVYHHIRRILGDE